MLPPSATLGVAVRLTVVVPNVSVMWVTAAAGLIARLSKLPPAADAMVALTSPLSRYTSSPGAATGTLPEAAPAAIVIMVPLLRVTLTGVCATWLRLAV